MKWKAAGGILLLMAAGAWGLVAQVIETKKGPVEFIGLEQWTPEQVDAKLNRLPDGAIHYCAADLKTAGFADASVNIHVSNDSSLYTVVSVVEGKRRAEIQYRAQPSGAAWAPSSWDALKKLQPNQLLGGQIYGYGRTLVTGAIAKKPEPWWDDLRARNTEADYQGALAVLRDAIEPTERSAAALVLMNFADRDDAWQALAGGLRDPSDLVTSVCSAALDSVRDNKARIVDWKPAATDLAAVLRGTNLFAFQGLVRTLAATGIDSNLAALLLRNGGGRMLLAYLGARHDAERKAAHALLVQLRGGDLGELPEAWANWLATL